MTAANVHASPVGYLAVLRNAYRKHYSERTDEWTADIVMRCVPALAQGQLKLPPSARALDIGCGSGRDVRYLSSILNTVVGIDIVPHRAWRSITGERAPGVTFIVTDLLSYETADRYDLIMDNGCFHHQHEQDLRRYLGKIADMLDDDGTFVLSTFKNPVLRDYVDGNGRLHKYFTDRELWHTLDAAGLVVRRQIDMHRVTKPGYYRISLCGRKP